MGFFKKLKFWRKKNKGADFKKRVEELEKKNAELQDKLEENDREWDQVVAILRGQTCEPEEMIAARDGEMDANQQTGEMDANQQTGEMDTNQQTGEMDTNQQTVQEDSDESTLQPAGSSARQQEEQTEVDFTMKKLKEDKDLEMHEIRPRVDKTMVVKHIRELQDFVLCLKLTVTNLESDHGERIEIQNKQQEELQELRVKNNQLQNKYVTMVKIKADLLLALERAKITNDRRDEYSKLAMKICNNEKEILVMRNKELQKKLEQLQIANDNLKTDLVLKMKDWEEQKEILINRNKELQKQLEAMRPVQNLHLVGGSSQRQQGRQCGLDTADGGKLSLQKFKFIRVLGEGGFGTVVLAKGKLLGGPEQLYAIKTVKKQGITRRNICEIAAEKEALMLSSGHPFITTLYSCFQNKEHLFFVMEFMSGGNLKQQLYKVEFFSEKRTQFYAAEITLAVQFLHEHGILHRDLKLENMLVGSDGHCKVADFGLSKLGLFRYCKTSTFCGTLHCLAPEVFKNLPYDHGADWWAVGVMIYEMITGHPPFFYDKGEDWTADNAQHKLAHKILNNEVVIPKHMSSCAALIVLQLLTKNPELRLGFSGSNVPIRQHPFFRGIDWLALQEKRVEPPEEEKFSENTEEDSQGFSNVLKVGNSPDIVNQSLFEGFSFINYRAKRDRFTSQQRTLLIINSFLSLFFLCFYFFYF